MNSADESSAAGWDFRRISPLHARFLSCRDCQEAEIRAAEQGITPPPARMVAWIIVRPDGTWQCACQLHVFTPQVPR